MVESCLAGRPPDEVVAFAVDNADGLPLLVEELLTGLGSVGALTPAGRLVGPLTPGVPRTFAATVLRRVADLDPYARAVVQAAAVLGRRFDWSLLPDVTGLSRTAVLDGLRTAVRSGLVVVDTGETFRFRHALTGDAIVDDLLPPERRALAHAAAEIVERRDPEAYALAAGLRAAAGEEERAAELSVAAGRQAVRRGALHSADLLLSAPPSWPATGPSCARRRSGRCWTCSRPRATRSGRWSSASGCWPTGTPVSGWCWPRWRRTRSAGTWRRRT